MLKTLWKQVGEYKRDSFLTPVFMLCEVIFETLIPYFMGLIINELSVKDREPVLSTVFLYGGIMLILAAGGLWSGIMGGKYGASASTGFAKNLRKAMYRNIQTFSFSNIDRFSTASLVTRMTTDVSNVQNAYQMILRICMRAPSSLIVATIMAISISARLSSVYLLAFVFLLLVFLFITKNAMALFMEAFPKYDKLNESVQENVNAIRVVKGFVREEHENTKFMKASRAIYDIFVKAETIVITNMPAMMIAIYTSMMLISWFGAKMIVAQIGIPDGFSIGNLSQLIAYCMQILMSMMMLAMIVVMVTMSSASAKRIVEVLNEETDISNPENPVMEVKDGSIVFENAMFRYNENSESPVLVDIDLSIRSGESIGIIGGTGSSKSSLVNLISRLYDVNSGSVSVGGIDVRKYDLTVLRDSVAVVLQKNVLFSGTIIENLRWGKKDATPEECREACRIACADEFVESFPDGYDSRVEQGGTNLSGGQKQRLCIARALLKKPKVLILDDSTSAVDTATDATIRKSMREFMPDMTKIIIAQRVSSVQDMDRIIVMDKGRIDAIGTHEELLKTNDIYKEVYESQTKDGGDFDSQPVPYALREKDGWDGGDE
ncbi:MAG: ABC transporter ATP-binding protein/permease [Eubacterium sp.]|nr:ABC transporter ATP-binding protein/permease [Eubacterium sp.]